MPWKTSSDKHSPREIRQLDFLSQFTTDIRYIKWEQNTVADALSRLHLDAMSTGSINLEDIARAQLSNQELEDLKFPICSILVRAIEKCFFQDFNLLDLIIS